MKTVIINLYGGPGTGKSTSAAYLYYLLKECGLNAELVREYVKDWAWEERKISTYDQIYFLGKQSRRESLLYGKVDAIVTDSPVMLGAFYAERYCPHRIADGVAHLTAAFYQQAHEDGHVHHHVMLRRSKGYNPAGRFQTEAEAREMDGGIHRFLENRLPTIDCGTTEQELRALLLNLGIRPFDYPVEWPDL